MKGRGKSVTAFKFPLFFFFVYYTNSYEMMDFPQTSTRIQRKQAGAELDQAQPKLLLSSLAQGLLAKYSMIFCFCKVIFGSRINLKYAIDPTNIDKQNLFW